MLRTTLLVLLGTIAAMQPLRADETPYFVSDGDFQSSLGDWYTMYQNHPNHGRGDVEWSARFDGSAHLWCEQPGTVDLADVFGETLNPGDVVEVRVTLSDLVKPGNFGLSLGRMYKNPPECQMTEVQPASAGTYDLRIECNRAYPPGTAIMIGLAVWSGRGDAWVQYVHLTRRGE